LQQEIVSKMQPLLVKCKPDFEERRFATVRLTNEEIQLQSYRKPVTVVVVLKKGKYRTILFTSDWDRSWVNTHEVWTAFEHIVQHLIKLNKKKLKGIQSNINDEKKR